MRRFIWFSLFFATFTSNSLWAADAIPVGATVCNVVVIEENAASYYSCDGSLSQPLDPIPGVGGELFEITSGQLAKFMKKGYRLIDCQLATFTKALNSCLLVRSG